MVKAAVATTSDKVPATPDLAGLMQEDAGVGISTAASDNLVPQISVLQPLSPEVLDGPDRLEGAKAGDFLLGANTLVPGKTGFFFQPCAIEQIWLEFVPLNQGGGYVASHPFTGVDGSGNAIPPPGTHQAGAFRYVFENDNEAVHYRQVAGLLWQDGQGLEYVISFKSTGHTIVREWMTKAGRIRFPNGSPYPLWSHVYKLTTSQRRNKAGQWFVIDIGDPIMLGPDAKMVGDPTRAYLIGKTLNQAFSTGEKQADRSTDAAVGESSSEIGDKIPF